MTRPIIISDEVTAAARKALSLGLDAAQVVSPAARLLLETVVLDNVLQAAFKEAAVDVSADTVTITDERPG